MPFSVLVLCQIRAGANDVCYTLTFSLQSQPATWSFIVFVIAIIHWISSNSLLLCSAKETVIAIIHWISSNNLLLCSAKETFSPLFQSSFPQPLPGFTFIVAFCFSHKNVHVALFASTLSIGFLSFLISLTVYFSAELSSAAALLTRASLLYTAYLARLHFSSSTQFLRLTRPLPPSIFGM